MWPCGGRGLRSREYFSCSVGSPPAFFVLGFSVVVLSLVLKMFLKLAFSEVFLCYIWFSAYSLTFCIVWKKLDFCGVAISVSSELGSFVIVNGCFTLGKSPVDHIHMNNGSRAWMC